MAAQATQDPKRQIVPFMQAPLARYAELVESTAAANLAGLTMFGPVVGADFDPAWMAATSVVVLREMDLDWIRRIGQEHGPELGRKHIAAPLVMTAEYIASSLDAFPLEFLEIHQRRATLAGDDYFESIEVDAPHIRLQCEREFKGILIRMRQGVLAAAGRDSALEALELDVGVQLVRTLRGLNWLKGSRQSLTRDAVVAEAEKHVGQSLPGARSAVTTGGEHGWEQFRSLYRDIETLARMADEL